MFGDDVAKSMKEISDTNKALSTFAPSQYCGYGGKGPRIWGSFLGSGRGSYGQNYGRGDSKAVFGTTSRDTKTSTVGT